LVLHLAGARDGLESQFREVTGGLVELLLLLRQGQEPEGEIQEVGGQPLPGHPSFRTLTSPSSQIPQPQLWALLGPVGACKEEFD